MLSASYKTNVFALLSTLKENYRLQDKTLYSGDDTKLIEAFLSELENYIKEASFTTTKTERGIIEYHLLGYDTAAVMSALNIVNNTYRSSVSRLTDKFNKSLFIDGYCPEGVVSMTDMDLIKSYYLLLKALRTRYNVYEELPADVICTIKGIKGEPTLNDFSEQDYFEAMYVFAVISKTVRNKQLNRINPKALKYVFNQLSSGSFNDSVYYTQEFMKAGKKQTVSDSNIAWLKQKYMLEVDTAKVNDSLALLRQKAKQKKHSSVL